MAHLRDLLGLLVIQLGIARDQVLGWYSVSNSLTQSNQALRPPLHMVVAVTITWLRACIETP
jgi:hypothetical protein